MSAAELELPAGARLVHIGPHKTGTTFVQSALHLARAKLAARGIIYPGTGQHYLAPILAVTGQPALLGERQPGLRAWTDLVRTVHAAGAQRVVLSSEFLAQASPEVASRVVAELGGPAVHVVVTLRPLTAILPSQWQQYVQNGFQMPYEQWLAGILADPPVTPTPAFWQRHRHDVLIARWAAVAGVDNVRVVVADGADPARLLRAFEAMLGLPPEFLVAGRDTANRSLTQAEAEVVRRLNDVFRDQHWPAHSYPRFVRNGAVHRMKVAREPGPDEPRIQTPAWALERAAELGAEMAANIRSTGVQVVGDLAVLSQRPHEPAGNSETEAVIPAEAAVQAIVGALLAGGAAGSNMAESLAGVGGRIMLRVLLERSRQRMRRSVTLPRPLVLGRPGSLARPAGLPSLPSSPARLSLAQPANDAEPPSDAGTATSAEPARFTGAAGPRPPVPDAITIALPGDDAGAGRWPGTSRAKTSRA
jgi:hypothetical protein